MSSPNPLSEIVKALANGAVPERVKILKCAITATNGDRDVEYGDPAINLGLAGELKRLAHKHAVRDLSPAEWEAVEMVMTKLARILTGPEPKLDTYIDGAAYFAIAGEMALRNEPP